MLFGDGAYGRYRGLCRRVVHERPTPTGQAEQADEIGAAKSARELLAIHADQPLDVVLGVGVSRCQAVALGVQAWLVAMRTEVPHTLADAPCAHARGEQHLIWLF